MKAANKKKRWPEITDGTITDGRPPPGLKWFSGMKGLGSVASQIGVPCRRAILRYEVVRGQLRPTCYGIVIPADAEHDFRLALSRRFAASFPFLSRREVEFSAAGIAGHSARGGIATFFLKRIGFPRKEFGDIFKRSETLARFKAGLSADADWLLSLSTEGLEKVARERGVRLTMKSRKTVHMVREIVEAVPDQELFDRDVAESCRLREELQDLLLLKTNGISWNHWHNYCVSPAPIVLPSRAKTAEVVRACLEYREGVLKESKDVVADFARKCARWNVLLQTVSLRSGMHFESLLLEGAPLPGNFKEELECIVEHEEGAPMERINDFCRVVKKIRRLGAAAGGHYSHGLCCCIFALHRHQFCFEPSQAGPFKFFDTMPAEVRVRIAEFLTHDECVPLVSAVPSLRSPVYARLRKDSCLYCDESFSRMDDYMTVCMECQTLHLGDDSCLCPSCEDAFYENRDREELSMLLEDLAAMHSDMVLCEDCGYYHG